MTLQVDAQKYAPSPEVHSDKTVTFRYFAPKAESVRLTGNVKQINGAMEKDDSGIWSITVGPLTPNTYPYRFNVDGAIVLDPVNRNTKAWLWMENLVVVPADKDAEGSLHHVKDVPHGTVSIRWYRSPRLDQNRRVFVYTPPGYEKADTDFPVLYLMHGFGDDESAWSRVGQAQHIVDNMLAAKKCKPAIIVMPFGHKSLPKSPDFQVYGLMENMAAVEKELLEGVMPFIEDNYRCKSDAAHRAVAGLSMGGGQALQIGINNSEKFKWIAGLSSSIMKQKVDETAMSNLKALKENKHWIWLGCGRDDFLLEDTKQFDKWLTENNIDHKTRLTEGAHNWRCWRGYLEEIMAEIFAE